MPERRRRADAERSISSIVAAAAANPTASMSEIARAAGVGRVTLYAHFPSREDLLEAVAAEVIARTEETIAAAGLDDLPAREALTRLVRDSWHALDRHRSLFAIANTDMAPATLRRHHDTLFRHLESLIARGQRDGEFRTDLPVSWLVTVFYSLLHGAAQEVESGQRDADEAGDALVATLNSAFSR